MAGTNEEVKLLGMWSSLFCWRVEIALKLKGISYEYIEEDLLGDKSSLLLELNPVHKKIPVLVHKGKPIAESLIIVDETWTNNPILPLDPYDRAMARFWTKFFDEKVVLSAYKVAIRKESDREEAIKELQQHMILLEKELKGKDFFGGENIGYVDIVGIIIMISIKRMQETTGIELISEENFPNINKWIKKLSEIDAVKQCIPPKDKYNEFMEIRVEMFRSAQKQVNN